VGRGGEVLETSCLFPSHPGKDAWRRQRSQASDFGRLGLRCMPGDGVAWQGTKQTGSREAEMREGSRALVLYGRGSAAVGRRAVESLRVGPARVGPMWQ